MNFEYTANTKTVNRIIVLLSEMCKQYMLENDAIVMVYMPLKERPDLPLVFRRDSKKHRYYFECQSMSQLDFVMEQLTGHKIPFYVGHTLDDGVLFDVSSTYRIRTLGTTMYLHIGDICIHKTENYVSNGLELKEIRHVNSCIVAIVGTVLFFSLLILIGC